MNDEQLLRYSRQIMLQPMDFDGQEKLLSSRVLILGMGGLGCPAAQYLTSAGVGHLVLVDPDTVEITNLQRQLLYSKEDCGTLKVVAAHRRLSAINSDVKFEMVHGCLGDNELDEQVSKATVVLDCTDNYNSRFVINKACVRNNTPLVSGAAIGFSGQLTVYDRRQNEAPCYRCLYDEQSNENLTCSQSGILGPVVGTIGVMQALEAIKIIAAIGKTLSGRLILFDAMTMDWQTMNLSADPDCPVCGHCE